MMKSQYQKFQIDQKRNAGHFSKLKNNSVQAERYQLTSRRTFDDKTTSKGEQGQRTQVPVGSYPVFVQIN